MRSIRQLKPTIYRIYGLNRSELDEMPHDELIDLLADLAQVLNVEIAKGGE